MTTYQVGQIVSGKITGIQPYGAFVALDENTQGLIHISEIKHGFVKNIFDEVTVGEEVRVKIIHIDTDNEKISLSLKALEEKPAQKSQTQPAQPKFSTREEKSAGFNTLRDKLQEWIAQQNDLIKK